MKPARLLLTAGALLSLSVTPARAMDLVSITIVDTPRPQPKWGYAPAARRVQPGTWVTWSNTGEDAHTVTAFDAAFDSGNLDPSEGYSWYFDTPGTFRYFCTLHPWMTGKIVVGNGSPPPPEPPQDGSTPPPSDSGT